MQGYLESYTKFHNYLGQGSFGPVYKAKATLNPGEVTVKVLASNSK